MFPVPHLRAISLVAFQVTVLAIGLSQPEAALGSADYSTTPAMQRGVTITGVIEDQTYAPICDAKLKLINKANGEAREASADNTGRFSFDNVLPGEYRLRAEAKGFDTIEIDIAARSQSPAAIRLLMKVTVKQEMDI